MSDQTASSNITTNYASLTSRLKYCIIECFALFFFLGIKHECQANGPEDLNRACIAEKLGGSLVVAFEGSPVQMSYSATTLQAFHVLIYQLCKATILGNGFTNCREVVLQNKVDFGDVAPMYK